MCLVLMFVNSYVCAGAFDRFMVHECVRMSNFDWFEDFDCMLVVACGL